MAALGNSATRPDSFLIKLKSHWLLEKMNGIPTPCCYALLSIGENLDKKERGGIVSLTSWICEFEIVGHSLICK